MQSTAAPDAETRYMLCDGRYYTKAEWDAYVAECRRQAAIAHAKAAPFMEEPVDNAVKYEFIKIKFSQYSWNH
jgi:hypothetical protein